MKNDASFSADNHHCSQALASCGLSIRREGCAVIITLGSNSEYAAIELFDRLTNSAKKGSLRLDLDSAGSTLVDPR